MKIRWILFNAHSGKCEYNGISKIPAATEIWHKNAVELIADNQAVIYPAIIKNREFHLIVESIVDRVGKSKIFTHFYEAQL